MINNIKHGVYNKAVMAVIGAVLVSVITALSKGTSGSALVYIALQTATTAGAVWLVPNTSKETAQNGSTQDKGTGPVLQQGTTP